MGTQDVIFQAKDSAQDFNQFEILEDGIINTGVGTAAPAHIGTFSPAFVSTANVFNSATASGRFFRLGKAVWIQLNITQGAGGTNNTGGNAVTITGLPFTSANVTGLKQALTISGLQQFNQSAAGVYPHAYIAPNTTVITLAEAADDGAEVPTDMDNCDKSGLEMSIAGVYFTD
tara:strand:+ start:257 stop:778 length:522 start_codon:yes stop_codon:yes gene_type:complete